MGDDERAAGFQARKHDRSQSRLAVPTYIDHDTTGQCETPLEVQEMRGRRTIDQRIERLEVKSDTHGEVIARMDGKLDTLVDLAAKSDAERERRAAADAVALAAKQARQELELGNKRKHTIAIITAVAAGAGTIVAALAAAGKL